MSEEEADDWDCHVHIFDTSLPSSRGHYTPVDWPLSQIEALAQRHGVGHLVLVQPSVYGTDNTLLLQTLATEPGRHRGVVVVGDSLTEAALDAMHELGVRGIRFNLASPVGESALPLRQFQALAPQLARRGWHVQWYARPADLVSIAALHKGTGLTCVLDHLGGLDAEIEADDPAWRAVEDLAGQGAWVKVSGLYRLKAQPPYAALVPHIRRLAGLFGQRMVWGSDWPHTMFAPDALPSYASTWQPVIEAFGLDTAMALRGKLPALYV